MHQSLIRIRHYLHQHWSGQQSLLQSIVVNVVLPVVTVLWIARIVVTTWSGLSPHDGMMKQGLLLLTSAVAGCLLLAGFIATNRKQRLQQGHSGTSAEILLANAVLTGIAGYCVVATIDNWTEATAAQVNKAFLADVKQPFVELSLQLDTADPKRLLLDGEISITASKQFAAFTQQHPQLQQVVLTSIGGNVYAARGIASHIERLQLATHVESRCFSSCTLLFASGSQRTASSDARFGFHQYRYNTQHTETLPAATPELDQDASYLQGRGIATGFVDRIRDTPATELWTPSLQVLIDAGFLHAVKAPPEN